MERVARKHGHARKGRLSPTWCAWRDMRSRCHNPNVKQHKDWGGRGIAVCERWNEFANFLSDMGEKPAGMTLERRDVDKGYDPGNCCWATRKEQARNQRSNVLSVEQATEIRAMRAATGWGCRRIAKVYGVSYGLIGSVIYRNHWS